jgi:hypothetical protein
MMAKNNLYEIEGILYSKRIQPYTTKKGEKGESRYIILETTRTYTFRNKDTGIEETKVASDLPEFKLRNGLNIEEFSIKDPIKITFALRGQYREWVDKNTLEKKKAHFTDLEAIGIEFADINHKPAKRDNKVEMNSLTDTRELEIFMGANEATPDFDDDQLPF